MSLNLKRSLQRLSRTLGLYERLKESRLYDFYWMIANPILIRDQEAELTFYRALLAGLPGERLIFDIGANCGAKTAIFTRLGARVVAVDPDPSNQRALRRRFVSYRLRPLPVTIVTKAISDSRGVDEMWIDAPGSAKNTLSRKWVSTLRNDGERFGAPLTFGSHVMVETTTLDALIEAGGVPQFIKIDVEGFETRVLAGLSRPVPCLSFEVNLPEFRSDGAECVRILERLDPAGVYNYTADCTTGFAMPAWVRANAFLETLASCEERSIEVFWKSS